MSQHDRERKADYCSACVQQYQVPVYGQPGTLPTAQGIPVAMVADGARVPLYSKGQSEY